MATEMAAGASGNVTLYLFMLAMLLTGTVNMLMLKFQHMQKVPLVPHGPEVHFDHPWVQAGLMMVGEFFCLPVFYLTSSREDIESSKTVPKWVFLVPCCCDLIATALLCAGLGFIAVSVAQMCRGTVVVFVCALSVTFLRRRQYAYHLAGVALVALGIIVVASSALSQRVGETSNSMMYGVACVIAAQLFQASMYVYEEKIMSQFVVKPLHIVGMEGAYGIGITSAILVVLGYTGHADTGGALHQAISSTPLLSSILGSMLAVAVFNFAGANVTQRSSAVARTTIKISTTILIWIVELACGWNTFSMMQFCGFALVAFGTLLYNRLIIVPGLEPFEAAPLSLVKATAKAEESKA